MHNDNIIDLGNYTKMQENVSERQKRIWTKEEFEKNHDLFKPQTEEEKVILRLMLYYAGLEPLYYENSLRYGNGPYITGETKPHGTKTFEFLLAIFNNYFDVYEEEVQIGKAQSMHKTGYLKMVNWMPTILADKLEHLLKLNTQQDLETSKQIRYMRDLENPNTAALNQTLDQILSNFPQNEK